MSWSRWLNRSLRLRLTATLCTGLGLVLAAMFVAFDWTADEAFFGELDNSLHNQARVVLAVLGHSTPEAMGDPMNALMPEFRRDVHSDFFQIRDAAGTTLSKSDSCGGGDMPEPPPFAGEGPAYFDVVLPNGLSGRAAAIRARVDSLPGHVVQPITVMVAEETVTLNAMESRAHYILTAVLVLTLAVSSVLAGIAVQRGLRPLREFGERAARLASAPRTPGPEAVPMPLELVPMARSLDTAFAHLLAAVERERRFARTAAHELRTPLAELRATAELALRHADPAEMRQALGGLLVVAESMSRALDGLLALARYEAGLAHVDYEPLDLRALVLAQIALQRDRAQQRGLAWQVTSPDEIWVSSDPLLLERIVANLVHNAVDYAPSDTRIEVAMGARGESARLDIANAAPGLTPERLRHFGEAHWRGDASVEPEAHGGLGLALARSIAGTLGLQLDFALHDGRLHASVDGLICIACVDGPRSAS